jgi:hypothetical protein
MNHTVKKGECLSSIADQYGFFWETLWVLPENRKLRELRRNPNVLLENDKVFIPEKRLREESCATGGKHVFQLKGVPVKVVFRVLDVAGNPRAGEPYSLDVDGKQKSGTVPDDGIVSQKVPPTAKQAKLKVGEGDREDEFVFDLGHLDPVEMPSGVRARLRNLGFYNGAISDAAYDADAQEAIRRFQESAGLPESGDMDAATQQALLEKHGC